MKKQLLFAVLAFTAFTSNAQQNNRMIISNEKPKQQLSPVSSNQIQSNLKVAQITGGISSSGYLAGATNYPLDMYLVLTNTDLEFVDSISIKFPAGITPVSSPNNPFPSAINPTVTPMEAYNGVFGQAISWGDDDNNYGGIADGGNGLDFQVLVNVVGGLVGPQVATITLSGDGYSTTFNPGDAIATFTINPKPSVDLTIVNIILPSEKCTNTATEQLGVWYRNNGTTPASTFTLSYSINGGTSVQEVYSGPPIAPSDTLKYTYTTVANLSAPMVYSVNCSASITGDGFVGDNAFTLETETTPKLNAPYTTGFESIPATDLANITIENVSGNRGWALTSTTPHSGIQCAVMTETVNGVSEDWIYTPCLNLQTGSSYYVRYWYKLATGTSGAISVLTGTLNAKTMPQVIKPVTALVAGTTWLKDSISFNVPTTGVYHLGFVGLNASASSKISLSIDDIKIDLTPITTEVKSVSIDEVSIFPNPTNGIINVYSPNGLMKVEAYNALGQMVFNSQTSSIGDNSFDLSLLNTGSYLVKFYNDRSLVYKQIVIQK